MHKMLSVALVALTGVNLSSLTAPAFAQEPAATQSKHYSVTTTLVGTLLDNPAANAILKRLIPTVYANDMFQTMGRSLTLKAIQQYEPDALSDENLAKIQAELDTLSARR